MWKWDVDAAGDGLTGLTGHAPHIPPPKVRFIHPNHTSLNILAKHPVDVLLWNHSGNDSAHASTSSGSQVTQWLKPALIIEAWAAPAALHPVHLAHPFARHIIHFLG